MTVEAQRSQVVWPVDPACITVLATPRYGEFRIVRMRWSSHILTSTFNGEIANRALNAGAVEVIASPLVGGRCLANCTIWITATLAIARNRRDRGRN